MDETALQLQLRPRAARQLRVGQYAVVRVTPAVLQVVHITDVLVSQGRPTGAAYDLASGYTTDRFRPRPTLVAVTGSMRTMHFNGTGGYLDSGTKYLDPDDEVYVLD